jgi:hypothetical protein
MSFLYPQFLWSLFAVFIPIIIHLFDFQKPKKLLFTNVRLLQQLQQSTNKGFKVKHLLVLLSRVLFILFLVLAFAQPFIPSTSNSKIQGKQTVSFYVDNSLSMQQLKEGKKSLDIALDEAFNISQVFPYNSSFQFLDNNFISKDQYLINKDQFKDRLTETNYSPITRDLSSVIKRQVNAFQGVGSNAKRNIFLISDFQKSTVGDLSKIKADSNTLINFVPVQNVSSGNVFIDTLWLENPFIKPKELNNLKVKVRNTAQEKSHKISLKLIIEGVQVSSNSITLEANSVQEVVFSFIINDIGFKKCSISFDDSPVNFDNTYYFTLQAAKPINVLSIGESQNNSLAKVYSSEGFFKLENNINNGINYTSLNKSNLIAVEEFDKLDESVLDQIKKQVISGSSVVLFPSQNVNQELANKLLKKFNINLLQSISTNEMIELKSPDINNPFFANIFEKFSGEENLPSANNQLNFKLKSILNFKNNQLFLGENSLGKGKVYLCSSSLNATKSNFSSHGLFVPVMYKLAILSSKDQTTLSHTFNEKNISLKFESDDKQTPIKLIKNGVEIVPQHQWVDGFLNIQMPKLEMEPGFYELKQGEKLLNILAFNYGKQESILSYYSAKELTNIFANHNNIKVFDVSESGEASASFKNEAIGLNFWKYCLILSLLFLLIEIILIRWNDYKNMFNNLMKK